MERIAFVVIALLLLRGVSAQQTPVSSKVSRHLATMVANYSDKAAEANKPCVINFSSCETVTLTSQRVLEGEALQALVGPGRIIVSACGNDGTRACYLEKGPSDYQAGTGIKNGIASGQIIDMDLVTPVNQLVRFDFLGMQLVGGGIEGTIMFNTDSISQVNSATFTTSVSMGQVQLTVEVSPYQDPRGTVYHIHGTLPHITYLVLCGATVLLTGNGPAWMYSDIGFNSLTNVTGVPQYCFAQPGHSVSWPANLPDIIAVGANGYKNTFTNIAGQTNTDMLDLPSRIPDLSQEQPKGVQFRVENRMLYVNFGDAHPKRITLNVYGLDGRLLLTRNGRNLINLSSLKDGVYAVQVVTDQRENTGSTLIRL